MTTLGSALPRAEKGSGKEQLGIVQKQEATLWGRSGHWSDVFAGYPLERLGVARGGRLTLRRTSCVFSLSAQDMSYFVKLEGRESVTVHSTSGKWTILRSET